MLTAKTRIIALLTTAAIASGARAQTFVNPTLTAPVFESRAYVPDTTVLVPASSVAEGWTTLDLTGRRNAVAARDRELSETWRSHYAWIVANQEAFRIALGRTLERPGYGAEQMEKKEVAYVAVGLAMLASNPLDAQDALDAIESPTIKTEVARLQEQYRRRLEAARQEIEGWPIIVFATGTVAQGLGDAKTATDDGNKPIGTGSLGAAVITSAGRFTARVSVISADALAPADFGALVLTPGSGNSLASGIIDWRRTGRDPWPNHFYATAAGIRLRAGTEESAPIARATVLGAGALWNREIYNSPLFETSASLGVEGGLGLRWLHGDAEEIAFFEGLFKNGRTVAAGPELGFAFSFGRVTAATQLYYLFNNSDEIAGLTGLQMVAGLSVSGEFIRGRLPARLRHARTPEQRRRREEQQRQ